MNDHHRLHLRHLLAGPAHHARASSACPANLDQHHLLPADPAARLQPALQGHHPAAGLRQPTATSPTWRPGRSSSPSFLAVGWAGYGHARRVPHRLPRQAACHAHRAAASILAGEMVPLFFEAAAHGRRDPALVSLLLGATLVTGIGGLAADPVPLRRVRHRLRRHELHRRAAHQERAGHQRALAAACSRVVFISTAFVPRRADARVDAERQRLEPGHATRSRRSAA